MSAFFQLRKVLIDLEKVKILITATYDAFLLLYLSLYILQKSLF